jgi:hypothetical protein
MSDGNNATIQNGNGTSRDGGTAHWIQIGCGMDFHRFLHGETITASDHDTVRHILDVVQYTRVEVI